MKTWLRHAACILITTGYVLLSPDIVYGDNKTIKIIDRKGAEQILTGIPLSPIEGIWEYPADEVSLMVLKDNSAKGKYNIFFVEGIDCRLWPGQELGSIEETANSTKFKISLCSAISDGLPGQVLTGLATLSDNSDVLTIEMPKMKLRLTPSIIIPTLWNRLRLNLRIKSTDPLEKLPEGWIKTFPSDDVNKTVHSGLRYL